MSCRSARRDDRTQAQGTVQRSEDEPRLSQRPGVRVRPQDCLDGKREAATDLHATVEETGREGSTFKTFVPGCMIGARAEEAGERLGDGAPVLVTGKLAYKAGQAKDSGKLMVMCFGVELGSSTPVRAVESPN